MAGNYSTLGPTTTTVITREELYHIVVGFPTPLTNLKVGQFVKLKTDGTVDVIVAPGDFPIGYVVSAYKDNDSAVRVATPFRAIMYGKAPAAATLTIGDLVTVTGFDATSGLNMFAVAASGQSVDGMVLVAASANGGVDLQIGALRQPYMKP